MLEALLMSHNTTDPIIFYPIDGYPYFDQDALTSSSMLFESGYIDSVLIRVSEADTLSTTGMLFESGLIDSVVIRDTPSDTLSSTSTMFESGTIDTVLINVVESDTIYGVMSFESGFIT